MRMKPKKKSFTKPRENQHKEEEEIIIKRKKIVVKTLFNNK